MVITPQYFALITKYVAHFVSQSVLFVTVTITSSFFNCAKMALSPGTVTYIAQMLCKDTFYIKLERDVQTKDCT